MPAVRGQSWRLGFLLSPCFLFPAFPAIPLDHRPREAGFGKVRKAERRKTLRRKGDTDIPVCIPKTLGRETAEIPPDQRNRQECLYHARTIGWEVKQTFLSVL